MARCFGILKAGFGHVIGTAIVLVLCPLAAGSEDKNGVSPQVISRPSGPGSLEGLGDAFQPALNTGTARYAYKFALPDGVAGFTPQLSLRYDGGKGFGVAGLGWDFGPAAVRRLIDKGTPQYGRGDLREAARADRFVGFEDEELVRLANGLFLAKIQGGMIRYEHIEEPATGEEDPIDYWIAHTKSGTKLVFGQSPSSRVFDAADSKRIAKWNLEYQVDTNGNFIEYTYWRPSGADRQVYCKRIRYGPGAPDEWTHAYEVEMFYDDRPDPFTDNRVGFPVRVSKRLARLDIRYGPIDHTELVRRYVLEYYKAPQHSLLWRVTLYSDDESCFPPPPEGPGRDCALPATTFRYDIPTLIEAATVPVGGQIIRSAFLPSPTPECGAGEALEAAPDDPDAEFVDLNADGLPDVLYTPIEGQHRAYLNRGVRYAEETGDIVHWEPLCMTVAAANDGEACDATALERRLSDSKTHLADMTGDGVAELVFTVGRTSVEYYENTGQIAWGCPTPMSVGDDPPPAPFDNVNRDVILLDLDFDKRTDVLRCNNASYTGWFNLGNGVFSDANPDLGGAVYRSGLIDCSESQNGVQAADMNGDRLADMVLIESTQLVFAPSLGYGDFLPVTDATTLIIPDESLDAEERSRAKLIDLNGDGLSDLAVERIEGADLAVWFNLGERCDLSGCGFRFSRSVRVVDLPISTDAAARWVDLNGNGTTDLVYADSRVDGEYRVFGVDVALLLAGSATANVLTGINNGYGRDTEIEYRSSTDFMVDAFFGAQGNPPTARPWESTLPFPTSVVSRTVTTFGLDLDCIPGVDQYVTDFAYRDGYYDPLEKQFRGFAFVKQVDHGDEQCADRTAPTLVTRFGFHTGAPDGYDNDHDGETDEADLGAGREEEPLKGMELWRETTMLPDDASIDGEFAPDDKVFERVQTPLEAWELRNLCTDSGGDLANLLGTLDQVGTGYRASDGFGREVRQAVRTQVDTMVIERGQGVPKHLRTRYDVDPFGNQLFEWNHGDLSNQADDLYEGTSYVLDKNAERNWVLDRTATVVQRDTRGELSDPNGAGTLFVSETRNYYDGEPFKGLSFTEPGSARLDDCSAGPCGRLHRTEAVISQGTVQPITERSFARGDPRDPTGTVDLLRQEFDRYGNATVLLDAEAQLGSDGRPDDTGHQRILKYDEDLYIFPVKETIVLGGDDPDLIITTTYDKGFGKPTSITDFNLNATTFAWDDFGRLSEEYLPGDAAHMPTRAYAYDLGDPVSRITTTAHPSEGPSQNVDVVTSLYFDGLGRKLGMCEHGGPVMREVTKYNVRGEPWNVYQPYVGQPPSGLVWPSPDPTTPAYTTVYDEIGRATVVRTPPDEHGVRATSTKTYKPLVVIEADGEDNNPDGPHFGTPKTLVYDGLERLIEVHEIERLSAVDSGRFVTQYRYTMPDLLAEIEDANRNVKYMRYDGLGRRIFMNDLNRGHMYHRYDGVDNLIETVDAKGQEIVYTYDGANRLLSEDLMDAGHPLSFHAELNGRPDVVYHYDAPSPEYSDLANTKGQIAWIEDLSGAEFRGYNTRGAQKVTIKRIIQSSGVALDYATTTLVDNLDRTYQIEYPDGDRVTQVYDSRGLLGGIAEYAPSMTYKPSGQRETVKFANGVVTTCDYDARLRLINLVTTSPPPVESQLQDLSYVYDQADNITEIIDGRDSILLPDPDQRPRSQTASFVMDDLYRLQHVTGAGYGEGPGPASIIYDHDRLGNMTAKASPDINDPDVNVGDMYSGGDPCNGTPTCGTAGRVGRNSGDPPGPHALTFSANGEEQRTFAYDANGNMTNNNGDVYAFDFKDRLGRVRVGGLPTPDIRYIYDYSSRRVIKRVDGEQTSYVDRYSEIRGGEFTKYVWNGDQRLAQINGTVLPGKLRQGVTFAADRTAALGFTVASDLGGARTASCDHDIDGDVDLDDLSALLDCLAGSNCSPHPSPPRTPGFCLGAFDSDADLDIDLYDFGNCNRQFTSSPPPASNVIYYHGDHLGSTTISSTWSGTLLVETVNYPFGTIRHQSRPSPSSMRVVYGYLGREVDLETDLIYCLHRHYDTRLARFCQVDPMVTIATMYKHYEWLGLSPYSYAGSNPVAFKDPGGLARVESIYGATKISAGGTVSWSVSNIEAMGVAISHMAGGIGKTLFDLVIGGPKAAESKGIKRGVQEAVGGLIGNAAKQGVKAGFAVGEGLAYLANKFKVEDRDAARISEFLTDHGQINTEKSFLGSTRYEGNYTLESGHEIKFYGFVETEKISGKTSFVGANVMLEYDEKLMKNPEFKAGYNSLIRKLTTTEAE